MIRNAVTTQDRIAGIRKAATLLVVLGKDVSGEVVRHLSEEEVEMLGREVAQMGSIPPEVAEKVLEECHLSLIHI